MKSIFTVLFLICLLALTSLLLFAPKTDLNDSIIQPKSYQAAISEHKTSVERIQTKRQLHAVQSKQHMQDIESLSADSQVVVFKKQTSIVIDSIVNDTLVEIAVQNLKAANLKFVELESLRTEVNLLEQLTLHQDSLISTLDTVIVQNEQLNYMLNQKDIELKKKKMRHRMELIGAGVLVVLLIVF